MTSRMLGRVHVRGLSLNCAMRDGRYCRDCGWDGRMGARDAKRAEARGVARDIADGLEDYGMASYRLLLRLNREVTDAEVDALYEAGCRDGGIENGPLGAVVDFDREAPSLALAKASVVRDIEKVPGLRVAGLELVMRGVAS